MFTKVSVEMIKPIGCQKARLTFGNGLKSLKFQNGLLRKRG